MTREDLAKKLNIPDYHVNDDFWDLVEVEKILSIVRPSDEKLNAAVKLHVDRIKSGFRDQPVKANNEAANGKFHFQEGIRAVLKLIQNG